jgi:hypothetical protein
MVYAKVFDMDDIMEFLSFQVYAVDASDIALQVIIAKIQFSLV